MKDDNRSQWIFFVGGTIETNSLSQNTPPGNVFPVVVEENQSEVSPEICKLAAKRFKFYPGMVICFLLHLLGFLYWLFMLLEIDLLLLAA